MQRCHRVLIALFALSSLALAQANNPESLKLDSLKKEALEKVDSRQQLVQQMVDQIFSFGELGFQEVETSKYVTGILKKNGFKVSAAWRVFRRRGSQPTGRASRSSDSSLTWTVLPSH